MSPLAIEGLHADKSKQRRESLLSYQEALRHQVYLHKPMFYIPWYRRYQRAHQPLKQNAFILPRSKKERNVKEEKKRRECDLMLRLRLR